MCGVEGKLNVLGRRAGNLAQRLAGDRCQVREVLALDRRYPLAADEVIVARADADLVESSLRACWIIGSSSGLRGGSPVRQRFFCPVVKRNDADDWLLTFDGNQSCDETRECFRAPHARKRAAWPRTIPVADGKRTLTRAEQRCRLAKWSFLAQALRVATVGPAGRGTCLKSEGQQDHFLADLAPNGSRVPDHRATQAASSGGRGSLFLCRDRARPLIRLKTRSDYDRGVRKFANGLGLGVCPGATREDEDNAFPSNLREPKTIAIGCRRIMRIEAGFSRFSVGSIDRLIP